MTEKIQEARIQSLFWLSQKITQSKSKNKYRFKHNVVTQIKQEIIPGLY